MISFRLSQVLLVTSSVDLVAGTIHHGNLAVRVNLADDEDERNSHTREELHSITEVTGSLIVQAYDPQVDQVLAMPNLERVGKITNTNVSLSMQKLTSVEQCFVFTGDFDHVKFLHFPNLETIGHS